MHPFKKTALELERKMNEFYMIGAYGISEQFFNAAMLILGMMSEIEYFTE